MEKGERLMSNAQTRFKYELQNNMESEPLVLKTKTTYNRQTEYEIKEDRKTKFLLLKNAENICVLYIWHVCL